MEYISIIISILGFVFTYSGLVRKVVTKEDLKDLIDRVGALEETQSEIDKKIAVMEYRLDHKEA